MLRKGDLVTVTGNFRVVYGLDVTRLRLLELVSSPDYAGWCSVKVIEGYAIHVTTNHIYSEGEFFLFNEDALKSLKNYFMI